MSGKKSFAAAAVCLLAVFAFAGMSCAGEIAMGSAKYLEDVMDHFKEVVEKESGGKITVKNLKASAFEDEVGNIELVMNGGLTATVVGINKLGVSPSMGFVSFPYMFPSLESADRVFLSPFMDKVNARLRAETKAGGGEILGVSWFTNDYRVLTNSKKEVASPADLEGLVIRVPESRVMTETFKSWGAKAIPLSWAEVPEAARSGIIHGQENPYSIIVGAELQETQKFLTPIKYNLWAGVVLVNAAWYDSLDAGMKAAVDKAGLKTAKWKMDKSKRESAEYIVKLQEAGVKFTDPANGETEWKEKAMKLWDELYGASGGKDWIDEVYAELSK